MHGEVPETVQFPEDSIVLGRSLGPSIDVGPALTAKILKQNGALVHWSTYCGLTPEEIVNTVEQATMKSFNESIEVMLGPKASIDVFKVLGIDEPPIIERYEDDDLDGRMPDPPDEELDATPETAMLTPNAIKRERDAEGNLIGRANNNPILDTHQYEVQFADGEVTELTANAIAEAIVMKMEDVLFDSFVDFRKDGTALSLADQKVVVKGRPSLRRTTVGRQLCCQWKDGPTSWEKLSDLKEMHPVQTAEYAVAQGIDHEQVFNWWVPHVLKKRDSIIPQVNRRSAQHLKRTHKWGLEVPRSVDDALAIDIRNGNTFWTDAIAKEMKNVRVAFKILDDGEGPPPCFQFIRCHVIFDIKMEDCRRKARLVAGCHVTDVPPTITYLSVVGRGTVRIALSLAALNDLEVKVADIMNAYVTAPTEEKIRTILGPEFGDDQGKKAVIYNSRLAFDPTYPSVDMNDFMECNWKQSTVM
eukprot:CCRYP_020633-RA/>CCRYP_020633-RA protein AED:0.28 eAED:0.28 QI:0/0/0/1/0/0/4/0/472